MTIVVQSRKTFFALLCILLFFNGIGLLWKRQITKKNNGWHSEFSVNNNIQNARGFSNWKRSVLETKTNVLHGENNSISDFVNNECDNIYNHQDKCEFVREHCQDYSGLINYLRLYFCNSQKWQFTTLILLFFWLLFLFGFIGIAASEFFCPNLGTIASKLKLSESMAGMTFLAFGNGSPDLFSTFSAITNGSGSLAIGELLGAASFITSVVAGSVAIVSPFRITKTPFLRDVIFFAFAICVVLAIIWDGKIHLWESIVLVLFYFTYVSVVVIGTWWLKDQKRRRWQEQKARDEYTPTLLVNGDTENVGEHGEEELDAYGYDTCGETDFLLSDNERIPDYTGRDLSMTPLTIYEENEPSPSYLTVHHHHPSSPRPARPIHRRSLYGAIEFRDVVNSLKLDRSARALGVLGRSYTTGCDNTQNRPSLNGSRRRSWASAPTIHIENLNDDLSVNTTGQEVTSELIPSNAGLLPNDPTQTPASIRQLNTLNIPRLTLIPPTPDQAGTPPDEITSPPLSTSPRSGSLYMPPPLSLDCSNFILDGLLHSSPGSSPLTSPLQPPLHSPGLPPVSPIIFFWDEVYALLFPSLKGFSQKSFIAKLFALMATPTILVLKITLPVVELEVVDSNGVERKKQSTIDETPSTVVIDDDPEVGIPSEERRTAGWNRWLTAAQFVFAPLFVSSVLLYGSSNKIILLSFLGGTIAAIMCILFTHDDKPPRFHVLLCFIGFGVAIVWIFLVANEVVGLLQAIGLIMGLSDAIVGLTIFAMGNSLGDFVANVTIAKMGFPTMAMSACFGGPMLNILLGIGIAGTYTTIHLGQAIDIKMEPTLFVSSIGLLLMLSSLLIYLPKNDFRMTPGWGLYVISIYLICMIINVTIELVRMNDNTPLYSLFKLI